MHIVNIMFSLGTGGIEQAFVDYCEGLLKLGHELTAVTHPQAQVNAQLKALGIRPVTLRNMGEWDMLAMLRLRRKLRRRKPDIVITQTNRSFALGRFAARGLCPVVAVAHNYNDRASRFIHADAVFATTRDLISFVAGHKVPESRIYHIPNMVRCEQLPQRGARHNPPVIGAMGRFVKKKGFDIFIDALQLLKEQGYHFTATLGGDGDEKARLKKRARAAGLKQLLRFPGWVEDKKAFYTGSDIFCLPSLHEPFGIVLLEAFTFGTPVVATDTEGPRDIITPNFDALIVGKESAAELAAALARMLDDPALCERLAANGFEKAKSLYSIESVCGRIEKALAAIILNAQAGRA